MNKETVTVFANYNKTANEKMNAVISTLDQGEWEKPLGGFFPSVRSLCSHLYTTDYNYLKRFRNLRSFTALSDPFFETEYSFRETIFEKMDEYLAKRPDLDSRIIALMAEVKDSDMGSTLSFINPRGIAQESIFGKNLLQLFNHQTHHRGMISLYLELLGRENNFSALT